MTSQNLWSRYVRHFVGITWHNVCNYRAKVYHVIQIKSNLRACPHDHQTTDRAYLNDIRVTNISKSFTHKMASKPAGIDTERNYVTVTVGIR